MAEVSYYETFPTKEAAEEWIEKVYANYHPAGYGTSLRAPEMRADGVWLVTGSRSTSCD